MSSSIRLKKSSVAGTVPSTLEWGEIAINSADGKLYYKSSNDELIHSLDQSQTITCITSQTLIKGEVVYASGGGGGSGKIEVSKFSASSTFGTDELYTLGIAGNSTNGTSNEPVTVITFGRVDGVVYDDVKQTGEVNTWPVGTVLYISATTTGKLTATAPVAPNLDIPIAMVVAVNGNSRRLFVRYEHGYHLNEIHDVYVPTPSDGQVLKWTAANNRWESGTVSAATETSSGIVELATTTEIITGTDTSRAITPSSFLGFSMYPGYIDCTGLISSHLTSVTSGTGAAASSSIYSIKLSTPTTAVGHAYSRLSSASSFLTQRTTLVQQSFSSPIFIAFRIRDQTTNSSATWRITFGKNFTSTVGSLANKGFGISKTGTGALVLTAHNGTSLVNTTSTFTPASINQVFDCLLYSNGAGTVTLYVNDTLVATNTNAPTGSEGLATPTLFMEIENTTTSSAQSHIEIGRPRLLFV